MSEQLSLDPKRSLVAAIAECFGLWAAARIEHHPVKTYCLFSGGDDSLVLLNLFGPHVDGVVYVNTGTGIPETTEFVRETVAATGLELHELHPPLSFEQVFLEDPIIDGLPGPGMHRIAYSRLKERALRQFRRDHHLKGRQRIMFLTGIRHDESVKRMGYGKTIVDREGRVVWVNSIYWLTRDERNEYLALKDITRNPVSEHLHISGECLCGCFAKPGELEEIAFFYPDVAVRIRAWQDRATELGLTYCEWGKRRKKKSDKGGRLCSTCDGQLELLP